VRLRVAEVDEHAVAHVFGDEAGEAGNGVGDAAVVGADDLAQILGIEPRRQRRRADQIAERTRGARPGLPGAPPMPAAAPRGFGVSPTIAGSCAEPAPIRSPTTTSRVAMPIRSCNCPGASSLTTASVEQPSEGSGPAAVPPLSEAERRQLTVMYRGRGRPRARPGRPPRGIRRRSRPSATRRIAQWLSRFGHQRTFMGAGAKYTPSSSYLCGRCVGFKFPPPKSNFALAAR
jgi:hypothetical protein